MDFNNYVNFTDTTAVYRASIEERYLSHLRYSISELKYQCRWPYEKRDEGVRDVIDVLESLTVLLEHDLQLFYEVMGFVGEAGEVANKAKKTLRDGADVETLKGELGGSAYYFARLAKRLYPDDPSQVMDENMTELQSRLKRNVLHGNGDDR